MAGNALLKAVLSGRPRQVRLLLDNNCDVNITDECGQTPLIYAAQVECDKTRNRLIRILLFRGATVDLEDVTGRNALMWACISGNYSDVALMLDHLDVDIDLNKRDVNGRTALFHAVTTGCAAMVKSIILVLNKYGMSVDVSDDNGTSPLMQAIKLGYDVCASILQSVGNAKIGLGMGGPKDVLVAERFNNNHNSFLPKLSLTSRTKVQRHVDVNSNVISMTSEEDDDENKYKNPSGTRPCPTPVTCSTPSDDEVDEFSSPLIDFGSSSRGTLMKMYNMKQDQMSGSYRQTAVRAVTPIVPVLFHSSSSKLSTCGRKGKYTYTTLKIGVRQRVGALCISAHYSFFSSKTVSLATREASVCLRH